MQLACEDQFEFNASFRKELKDLEMMETPCVGVDSDGQRHWLLKVNNDIYSLSLPSHAYNVTFKCTQCHNITEFSKYTGLIFLLGFKF